MKESFSIQSIDNIGDPTEGWAQYVVIQHICEMGVDSDIGVDFPKHLKSEKAITCPTCQGSVTITKDSGCIFIQK